MAIKTILRMILLPLLPLSFYSAVLGAGTPGAPKSVDYKRADTNFYARGDVLKFDPAAVILPPTAFAQNGDTYTYTPRKKAPKTVYLEASTDWVEPITPPDMPASLNIPPDAMQIREPQGDVQVALPGAPTNFSPVTDGMTLPNGAVIKTGTNATTAILFGGVDSARLMADSEAAVQQTVTPQSRAAEVDLTAGGVFSKVGTQTGVKSEYQVHTPFGNVLAQAGDFAAVATSARTDVWVSLGTVELLQPDGRKFGVVSGDGTGALKLIRFPAIASPAQSVQADSETLTAIMNFIPAANQKLAALHAKAAKGGTLTANQQAYLQRIKQLPALIKLALVEPPPPAPLPPTPAPATPAAPPVATAPPEPVSVIAHANCTIKFQGATMGLEEFQAKIKALVAAKPDAAVIIHSNPKMDYAKFAAVLDACKNAPVKEIAVAPPAPKPPQPAPPTPAVAATPASPPAEPPPATPAVPINPDVSIIAPTKSKALEPVTALVHEDGTVGFKGTRSSFAEFKTKLAAMVKATPARQVVIKTSGPKVTSEQVKAVLDACADAHVAHVTPPPPVTAETPVAAAPVTAETPPAPAPVAPPTLETPSASVNEQPVPAEIGLAADGTLLWNGTAVTEDDLNAKLADLAKTHPKNPLVMMKQPKVAKEQWMRYVDLCHSTGLKLLVKNAKPSAPAAAAPTAESPSARPATAEEGPAAAHPSVPPAPEEAVPVEIELTPDGQTSFLGETISNADLKTRLESVSKGSANEPVLIVKDEKVTRAQWQKIVDLCHAVGLKVRLKTVKSADSTSIQPAHAPAEAGETAAGFRATDKILPVEIGLAAEGKLTFEGTSVSVDELKARLATVAKTNPNQPVVILKKDDVSDESTDALVALCEAANVKATVKTEASFTPPAPPPDAAPTVAPTAENLPGPSVHMHPSMDTRDVTPVVDKISSPSGASMPGP